MTALLINEEKKKEIHKNEMRSSRIALFPKIVIVGWIAANIGTIAMVLKTDVETFRFIGWCLLAFVNILGIALLAVARIAVKRITGTNLSERINESMFINGSTLEYGYQNFADHTPADRVVIRIPFANIDSALIDKKRNKVTIRGRICQMYYDNYLTGETRAREEYTERTVVLYDYFEPSLIKVIGENAGAKVEAV